MADALDTTAKLFERSRAAIAEATRLAAQNREWQQEIYARISRMTWRASFEPNSLKLYSPLDFPDHRPAYEPFPSEGGS